MICGFHRRSVFYQSSQNSSGENNEAFRYLYCPSFLLIIMGGIVVQVVRFCFLIATIIFLARFTIDDGRVELKAKSYEIVYGEVIRVIIKNDGSRESVRILGVGSGKKPNPTIREKSDYEKVMKFLGEQIRDEELTLKLDPENAHDNYRDQFGRILAHVYLPDGTLLAERMIREGWCDVATTYSFNPLLLERYQEALVDAKNKQIGLWAIELAEGENTKEPNSALTEPLSDEKNRLQNGDAGTLKKRPVEKPQGEAFQAVLGLINDKGYSLAQIDPNTGIILTEWKQRDAESQSIGDTLAAEFGKEVGRQLINALSREAGFDVNLKAKTKEQEIKWVESKIFAHTRKLSDDKTEISINLNLRVRNSLGRAKSIEFPASEYDLFFDQIGDALGTTFPHKMY